MAFCRHCLSGHGFESWNLLEQTLSHTLGSQQRGLVWVAGGPFGRLWNVGTCDIVSLFLLVIVPNIYKQLAGR